MFAAGLAAALSGTVGTAPVIAPWRGAFAWPGGEVLALVGVRRHVPEDMEVVRSALAAGALTIVVGVPDSDRDVSALVRLGASLIPRDCTVQDVSQAISQRRPLRHEPIRTVAQLTTPTSREREVAGLLAQGMSNRQIAAELVISENTVRNHLGHIYAKLGVSSRTQAVLKAGQLGWLRLPQS